MMKSLYYNRTMLFSISLCNKEFLVQAPDGYLLRFSEDLGEKNVKNI